MPTLRDYQHAVAEAMSTGNTRIAAVLINNRNPPTERLQIHRNTMLSALTNTLVLTFPAVHALVGPTFFSQTARTFVQNKPPRTALLSRYGADFPDFLATYEPVRALPYLTEVARLEWTVECAAQSAHDAGTYVNIDLGGTFLSLATSLALLETRYPAEAIWRAVLNEDDEALGRIDTAPSSTSLAVWHERDCVIVQPLNAGPAAFVRKLLEGGDGEAAICAAALADPHEDPIPAITKEVLMATFAMLTPSTP